MGIETLSRGAKRSYEEFKAQEGNGIENLLFPILDEDISSAFMLDRLIQTEYGVIYRDRDNQSHVRPYQPGTGYIYDIPRATEKTLIGEELSDAAVSGLNATDDQASHLRKIMDDIVKHHVGGHNITKRKQAIDVIFDGEFNADGSGGTDLNLGIDYSRAAGNEITADFTATDTQPIALKALQDVLVAQGCSQNNMVALMGATWLADFMADTAVLAYLEANSANQLLEQKMMPDELMNTKGVKVVATYRAPGMIAPVYICSYSPGYEYIAYNGASSSAWITATKCAMFSLDSPRFRVNRGQDVINAAGRKARAVGDVVFDSFSSDDPVGDWMRSGTRHLYVPGNVNHTAVSTGTFS
jgi:hypothetical protein